MLLEPPDVIAAKKQVEEEVRKLVTEFQPHVLDISFEFERDWTGDPGVFFTVVLADRSAKRPTLGRVSGKVREALSDMVWRINLKRICYTKFRSKSEVLELQRRR